MSGPWDRPSSDDSDAAWPGEDVGRSSGSGASRDPASEGAPGWDDWPSAPPPDDYLIEEPLPPSSDPWAESWTDEDADAMLRAAAGEAAPPSDTSRWEPIQEPEPEREAEPDPEPPSADRWEPIREPEPEPAWQPAPEQPPDDRLEVDAGPRVEPWSPEADPWRFEPEPEPAPREADPQPPTSEPPTSEPASVAEASEPEIAAHARWPAPSREVPDWLAEPVAADTPEVPERPEPRVDERPQTDEPLVTAAADDGTAEAVESEPEAVEPEADPRTEPAEPEARAESGSFWSSILPWRSSAPAPAEAPSEPEPEPEPEPADEHPWIEVDEKERRAEPESVAPPIEPRWPASVPEPVVAEDTPDAQPEAEAEAETEEVAEVPAFVPIGGGLRYEPEPEAAIQAEPELEPEPDPEPMEPESEAQREWGDPDWADRGESTRVLPTDWTPSSPPAAIEPPRTGELEPTAGPIHTRLAEREGDELDDELVAPTIAEQAVPWLIGVILLLAGMVIVLLALIFAGDGSLGGSTPSPTLNPTLAAVPARETPSPTPAPTLIATPAPTGSDVSSPTPEATTTPEPLPQYGPLEMVYQGRAAALAPIYLLRRDFTVEEEPAILAQDGSLDVRRFAWIPDGTAGAGLLADVLVSIEPGQEKRRLGEGLVTITFGDDGSTVYAVRVTPDGGNDTATVLAIDFTSGDTEELASVTYARPQVGDEPALAEARFSDDGGAVRLYWMHEDLLRLWVLGAGAWTIDPSDGGITELDGEPLPTLVGPNGRQRISVADDDGTTTLTLLDMNERPRATTSVDGLVSHLRWSPAGDRVVFTIARSAAGGGILQDLFLWDLGDGQAPAQLTNTGAAFGAEWLGTQPRWKDQP